jgi:hypothetical protein
MHRPISGCARELRSESQYRPSEFFDPTRIRIRIHICSACPIITANPTTATFGVETWLIRLYKRDPVLRTIATKKADGFSHREIAGQLRMGLSSVEERVRLVKALLATRMSDAD